jgi:hypothetical protein
MPDARTDLRKTLTEAIEKAEDAKRAMWSAQCDLQNKLMQSIDFIIGNVVANQDRYKRRGPTTAELMAVARYIGIVD